MTLVFQRLKVEGILKGASHHRPTRLILNGKKILKDVPLIYKTFAEKPAL